MISTFDDKMPWYTSYYERLDSLLLPLALPLTLPHTHTHTDTHTPQIQTDLKRVYLITETDRNGPENGPKRTGERTGTDRNDL